MEAGLEADHVETELETELEAELAGRGYVGAEDEAEDVAAEDETDTEPSYTAVAGV